MPDTTPTTPAPAPDASSLIRAPWTPEQVQALNAFQEHGGMHPFTCGNDHDGINFVLIARTDGWHCSAPPCDYRQDWAHALMANPAAWPKPWPRGVTVLESPDPAPGAPDLGPAELTTEEARAEVDRLATELYRAQDAVAFVAECCDIADREGRTVTTTQVREWLEGAKCGRQLLADETDVTEADIDRMMADGIPVQLATTADTAGLRDAIVTALRATPATGHIHPSGQPDWDHHKAPGHTGHTYLATCALCQGDIPALTAAVLAVVQPRLDQARTRAEQAEDLLRVAHDTSNRSEAERARAVQRAEQAEAALTRVRELHRKANNGDTCVYCAHGQRLGYDTTWPCDTIRALTGQPANTPNGH